MTQFAERQHDRHGLDVHGGRMELELRPPLQVDKGTVIRGLAAERPPGRLRQVAAFGDDLGDLPAFEAVTTLGRPGHPVGAVRVAAVDHESPAEVAARADLTVDGAAGAVELLRRLAEAAAASPPRLRPDPPPPAGRPTSRPPSARARTPAATPPAGTARRRPS